MIEKEAMYKISYGLFVLTTTDGEKQNGCIVNTVSMITENPKRIVVFVNKANYTEELLRKTGIFNVSILTEKTPFDIFRQFGFVSGRDVDKFADKEYPKTENGLNYVAEYANAVLSAKVIDYYDYDTHTLFVAEVTEAKMLSSDKSVTYEYYQNNIKPKPAASAPASESTEKKPKAWVCKICGYTHEEEELPPDFICPWCKHPAEDFEPIY
jgi:flavin reductase (DIM6/NTAB) family NADH-FMN oxidoreductase RutF/rubredoxin